MYQRTVKLTIGHGTIEKLMQRIDAELASPMLDADGFIAYLAVPVDTTSLLTTRLFVDVESLDANAAATEPIAQAIREAFRFTAVDSVVDGYTGVEETIF